MEVGFSIDPRQGLSPEDELAAVRLGAELGYASAWTPAGGDAEPFERCLRWYRAAGLATGILVQPASAQPPSFYAAPARRLWAETQGHFVLGIGSGGMAHPLPGMAVYLESLRQLLPERAPLYAAALGPGMLRLAAEVADGVALNWCSTEQVAWSRARVAQAAAAAGRTPPRVVEYIRTAVDPDPELARRSLEGACRAYARGPKAYRRHFE
ncbi:MAG: LLM class flavin-dependent oxidoreductase, partial [Candidatus Dormibacteria bacterium]